MKKLSLWLLFLVIPLLLYFIHVYFTRTVDDHHYAINTDPDYAFLLSSIDISNLEKSNMVLHPGTTLQVMSHLIMRCAYVFSDNSEDDFQTSVLKNPVFYLNNLHRTFALFNIILVLFMGIFTYKITKKILFSLLIQFTPLLSSQTIILGLRRLTADVILVFISLTMVLILIKILHEDFDKKKIYIYSIVLGLVTGFGLATKITFIMLLVVPLIIIPFFIPRIVYILSSMISGFIFTLPISSIYIKIYKFLHRIFFHTGIYGRGEEAIIEPNKYMANLFQIVKENLPFIIILFISIVIIILTYISAENWKTVMMNIWFKLLFAITLTQIFCIMVVAKHFQSKYLLPVLCLSGLLLYTLYKNFNWIYQKKTFSSSTRIRRLIYFAASFFLFFSFINTFFGVAKFHHMRSSILKESIEIHRKIKNEFKDFGIIYYNTAPTVIGGLEFGNRWTPVYADALREIYGDRYFYHIVTQNIYNWGRKNKVSLEEIKVKYNNQIIFLGYPFDYFFRWKVPIQMPYFPLKDVFMGKYFTVYKLVDE
ncbi:MAG: hypothetical protein PVH61_29565 [Candidatus Aminicenantes bacterium]|jgi:hypothetical protein